MGFIPFGTGSVQRRMHRTTLDRSHWPARPRGCVRIPPCDWPSGAPSPRTRRTSPQTSLQWLTNALASGKLYPRIPRRRTDEGGFYLSSASPMVINLQNAGGVWPSNGSMIGFDVPPPALWARPRQSHTRSVRFFHVPSSPSIPPSPPAPDTRARWSAGSCSCSSLYRFGSTVAVFCITTALIAYPLAWCLGRVLQRIPIPQRPS